MSSRGPGELPWNHELGYRLPRFTLGLADHCGGWSSPWGDLQNRRGNTVDGVRCFRMCAAEGDPGERVAPRLASHDAMRRRGNGIALGKAMSLAVLCEMFDYKCWARDYQLQTCNFTEEQFRLGYSSLRCGTPDAPARRGVVVTGTLAGTVATDNRGQVTTRLRRLDTAPEGRFPGTRRGLVPFVRSRRSATAAGWTRSGWDY